MHDPLTWAPISLGRWAGTQVRVHILLIVFVVLQLLGAVFAVKHPVLETGCWIGLLFVALFLHELGHAAMATWLGHERDEVRLWPLGNMVSPSMTARAPDNALVALAGPMVNLAVFVVASVVLYTLTPAHFVWKSIDPLAGSGAPLLPTGNKDAPFAPASPFTVVWYVGWVGYLNWVLFLANVVIPALPFDSGRVLRSFFSTSPLIPSKDGMVAPWTARAFAIILAAGGVLRFIFARNTDGFTLVFLALLIEFMVRSETRMLEDGGFYEDGVFGYDFSEGYTSLEGSAAKVRPYRESALRRWRRRRSELRRQRRQARTTAEERRMDEILDKLYREGRAALTDEENRFLIRVSVKFRNKPKAHD